MAEENWVPYTPPWAPHIKGEHTPRVVDANGVPEEQKVRAKCGECGEEFRRTCSSGLVRHHVDVFARVHLHRFPLGAIPVKK